MSGKKLSNLMEQIKKVTGPNELDAHAMRKCDGDDVAIHQKQRLLHFSMEKISQHNSVSHNTKTNITLLLERRKQSIPSQ